MNAPHSHGRDDFSSSSTPQPPEWVEYQKQAIQILRKDKPKYDDYLKAAQCYNTAVGMAQRQATPLLLWQRAETLLNLTEFEEDEEMVERYLHMAQDDLGRAALHRDTQYLHGIYICRVRLWMKQERHDKALEDLKACIQLSANDVNAHVMMGDVYLRCGMVKSAAHHHLRALQLIAQASEEEAIKLTADELTALMKRDIEAAIPVILDKVTGLLQERDGLKRLI